MRIKTSVMCRTAAAVTGGLLLAGMVAAGASAETQYGNGDVDVNVSIPETGTPGALSMTIADTAVALTESGTTVEARRFTGSLPTVTVTDTRDADDVPEGAGWYVVGSASAFVGASGQPAIGADHLGWAPRLIDGGDAGLVAEGDRVDTVLDSGPNAVGLVDQELLALTTDSQAVNPEGSWTADAELTLAAEPDVAPGDYSSVLTLSLFE
jgi:hypothetical protein